MLVTLRRSNIRRNCPIYGSSIGAFCRLIAFGVQRWIALIRSNARATKPEKTMTYPAQGAPSGPFWSWSCWIPPGARRSASFDAGAAKWFGMTEVASHWCGGSDVLAPLPNCSGLGTGIGLRSLFCSLSVTSPGMPVRTDPDPSRKGQGRFLGRPPRHHYGWSRGPPWEERINPAGPALSLRRAICLRGP